MIHSMCLMAVHSYNAYHGQEVKPLRTLFCQIYVTYVTKCYGKATIVFDGYEDGPAIKMLHTADEQAASKDQMLYLQEKLP